MYCTRCGVQLRDEDRFCSQCAHPTGVGVAPDSARPKLSLPLEGKKIAGVCAGFARHLEVDVTLVRIVWLVFALSTGIGFIAYLIAWLLMPKDVSTAVAPVAQTIPTQHTA